MTKKEKQCDKKKKKKKQRRHTASTTIKTFIQGTKGEKGARVFLPGYKYL